MTSNNKHPHGTTHTRDGNSYKVGTIVECFDYGQWVSVEDCTGFDIWMSQLTLVNPENVEVLPFDRYRTKEVVKHEWTLKFEDLDGFIDWFEDEFEGARFINDVALTSVNKDRNVMYTATYTEEK